MLSTDVVKYCPVKEQFKFISSLVQVFPSLISMRENNFFQRFTLLHAYSSVSLKLDVKLFPQVKCHILLFHKL